MVLRILILFLVTFQFAFAQQQVRLLNFRNSSCDTPLDGPPYLRTRIIDTEANGDTLTIRIAATAHCCVEFIPSIKVENDILKLNFEESGSPCECVCCYELTYQLTGLKNGDMAKVHFKNRPIEQTNERYETLPIRFKLFHGDTINVTDKYGLKQGVWRSGADSTQMKRFDEYLDNNRWRTVKLYPNGNIASEFIRERVQVMTGGKNHFLYSEPNRMIEYYESGQKKRECHCREQTLWNSYTKGQCKEWDSLGKLVYEGVYR